MLKDFFDYLWLKYHHHQGMKALVKGRYARAHYHFQKALILSNTAEYQYNLGITLMSMGNYEESASYLHKVITAYPNNEMAQLAYAQCETMLRHWEAAAIATKELLAQHPSNISYQGFFGMIHDPVARDKYVRAKELLFQAQLEVEKHQLDSAITHLQEALEFDPRNSQIPNNIGAIMLSMKKPYQEILPFFEQALSLEPENEKIKRNIIYVRSKMGK